MPSFFNLIIHIFFFYPFAPIQKFSQLLIDFISETSVAMNIIQHKAFKKIISYVNPNVIVQDQETLWGLLEKKTLDSKGRLVEELHRHCPNGSLTADSWTSEDGRKFQAVSYHYLTPDFEMGKVLVGMDLIDEPQQKAEVLLKSLSKCNGVVKSSNLFAIYYLF